MQISKKQAAKAFEQWEREYREDPEKFMSDAARLRVAEAPYGVQCAETFFDYIAKHKEEGNADQ